LSTPDPPAWAIADLKISGHPAAEALARRDGDHDTFTVCFL
jgi:hypothetical protein